jgi:hypothetical protein
MVHYARKTEKARSEDENEMMEDNPNKSPFSSKVWWYIVLLFAISTIGFVLWGIASGEAGE